MDPHIPSVNLEHIQFANDMEINLDQSRPCFYCDFFVQNNRTMWDEKVKMHWYTQISSKLTLWHTGQKHISTGRRINSWCIASIIIQQHNAFQNTVEYSRRWYSAPNIPVAILLEAFVGIDGGLCELVLLCSSRTRRWQMPLFQRQESGSGRNVGYS